MSLDLASFAEGSQLRIINCTLDDKILQAVKRIRGVAFALGHLCDADDDTLAAVEVIHDLADGVVEQVEHARAAVRELIADAQAVKPLAGKRKAVRS